jgi:hypothetical protein
VGVKLWMFVALGQGVPRRVRHARRRRRRSCRAMSRRSPTSVGFPPGSGVAMRPS